MHPLETIVKEQLAAHDWHSVSSLVAVSGGADSVALLQAMARVGSPVGRLTVVHFNHGLRGEAADRDAEFVASLAERAGLAFVLGRAAEGLAEQGDSLENAARQARYSFFEHVANERGARYLFMAHTASDQAETILHRILRGTGLNGLAGIPAVRALSPLTTIVRPLLQVSRVQVIEYLAAIGQDFREDHTNVDQRFTRNRLRHDLLPKLAEEYNPSVIDALLRLGELADEAQACLEADARQLLEVAARQTPEQVVLSIPLLASARPYVLRQLFMELWGIRHWPLQAMTFEKWRDLAALATSSHDASLNLPGDIRAKKQGEQLMLSRPANG